MKIYFISFIFLLGLFSCKNEVATPGASGPDCSSQSINYIYPEISNFKFKKGTYWVYIDSVSLIIDTLTVDTVLFNGLTAYYFCPNNYYEKYVFIGHNRNYSLKYCLDHGRVQLNSESEEIGSSEIYESLSPKIDSIFIYDRYYKSVVAYTHAKEPSENNNKTIFYSNTEFGFLKKEVFSSSNQLISKKLLKDKFIIR